MEKYNVICEIGKGSYGVVSVINRKSDQKTLIWKELNFENITEKEKEFITNEINILQELNHPNIVKQYEVIKDDINSKIYIVMEYCEGGDLDKLILKNKNNKMLIDEKLIWDIIIHSLNALNYLHNEKKVLHRDIKPSNIFLDKDYNIKLGDFGLSRKFFNGYAKTVLGTPLYMPPEILERKQYNEKADIWALGCSIYELTSFRTPYEAPNMQILYTKIKSGIPQRIEMKYSDELWNFISKMLIYDYNLRPNTIQLINNYDEFILSKNDKLLKDCKNIKDKWKELILYEDKLKKKEKEQKEIDKEQKEKEKKLKEKERLLIEMINKIEKEKEEQKEKQKELINKENLLIEQQKKIREKEEIINKRRNLNDNNIGMNINNKNQNYINNKNFKNEINYNIINLNNNNELNSKPIINKNNNQNDLKNNQNNLVNNYNLNNKENDMSHTKYILNNIFPEDPNKQNNNINKINDNLNINQFNLNNNQINHNFKNDNKNNVNLNNNEFNLNNNQINHNFNNKINNENNNNLNFTNNILKDIIINNNSNYKNKKIYPKIGLKNLGDTSYLNAVLQILGNIEEFVNYFLIPDIISFLENVKYAMPLSFAIKELCLHLYPQENENCEKFEPSQILNALSKKKKNKNYFNNKRNNPNNLIIELLNYLNLELNTSKTFDKEFSFYQFESRDSINIGVELISAENKSIIFDLFNFFKIEKCRYLSCKSNEYHLKTLNYFILELSDFNKKISSNKGGNDLTLNDYLNFQLSKKKNENTFCDKCQKLENIEYYEEIYSSPNIFLFLLDRGKNFNSKNNLKTPFIIEDKINLDNFIKVKDKSYPLNYELIGIVSITINNDIIYLSMCKSFIDNKWYYYEDEKVEPIELNKVITLNNNNNNYIPCTLIYKRIINKNI